tara:strand:- start:605 stop:790 length:186 start_codon:yes stop_codon:yes gene_type:complete
MKYFLLILILFSLPNCSNKMSNLDDKALDIDIYRSDMTYEKFKNKVLNYADRAPYPSLTKK